MQGRDSAERGGREREGGQIEKREGKTPRKREGDKQRQIWKGGYRKTGKCRQRDGGDVERAR